MTDQDKILVQILATTDAVWRPLRAADWAPPAPANLYFARRRYAEGGVAFGTGSGGEADRKVAQRIVLNLAATGLFTLHGDRRRASVKLSEATETNSRALCGLPSIVEAHRTLRRVIELEVGWSWPGPLCSELWLAGLDNYADGVESELWDVQAKLASALCRGWVEGHSDLHGRVWYWATDQGREAAKLSPLNLPANLPEYSDAANELYYKETIAARSRLRCQKPEQPNEIGFVPLSASMEIAYTRRKEATADA